MRTTLLAVLPTIWAAISDTITVFGTAPIPVFLNLGILVFPPAVWLWSWIKAPKPFGWRLHMRSLFSSQFSLGEIIKLHWKALVYITVVILTLGGNLVSEVYKTGVASTKPDIDQLSGKLGKIAAGQVSLIEKKDKEIEELKRKLSEPPLPPSASLRYGTSEIASDSTGYLVRIPITSEGPSTAKQYRFITERTVEPSVLSDKDEELEWRKFIRKYPRSKWSHPEDLGMGDMRAFIGGVNGDELTTLINSPNGQMYFRGIAIYQTNIGERSSELCRRFHGPVWTPCSGHNRTIP
jgi:hypothetical protein